MSNKEKLHWDQSYSVGIKPIDMQHKKLFYLVNKLFELDEKRVVKEEIRDILYAFKDYTKVHFKDEEDYLLAIEYPDVEKHKEAHKLIVDRLSKIIRTPASLSIIKTKMKVFSKRVLLEHIIAEDPKISDYADEHKIKEEIYSFTE
jgi:hemerythrin